MKECKEMTVLFRTKKQDLPQFIYLILVATDRSLRK